MDILSNMMSVLSHGIPGLVVAGLVMILILLGLIRKDAGLMIFAAFLFIPFAYSMGTWGGLRLGVRLMPLLLMGSAFSISKDEPLLAWVLPILPAAYLIYALFNIIASDL